MIIWGGHRLKSLGTLAVAYILHWPGPSGPIRGPLLLFSCAPKQPKTAILQAPDMSLSLAQSFFFSFPSAPSLLPKIADLHLRSALSQNRDAIVQVIKIGGRCGMLNKLQDSIILVRSGAERGCGVHLQQLSVLLLVKRICLGDSVFGH